MTNNESNFKEAIKALRCRTNYLERDGEYWTEEDMALLEEMFDEGIGISEMALRLKRTEFAVIQKTLVLDQYRMAVENLRTRKPPADENKCKCDSCKADPSTCAHCWKNRRDDNVQ